MWTLPCARPAQRADTCCWISTLRQCEEDALGWMPRCIPILGQSSSSTKTSCPSRSTSKNSPKHSRDLERSGRQPWSFWMPRGLNAIVSKASFRQKSSWHNWNLVWLRAPSHGRSGQKLNNAIEHLLNIIRMLRLPRKRFTGRECQNTRPAEMRARSPKRPANFKSDIRLVFGRKKHRSGQHRIRGEEV